MIPLVGFLRPSDPRVGGTVEANAWVTEVVRPLASDSVDLGVAIAARRLSMKLKVRDPVEYWKSAPYFLDFMRDYQFRKAAVGVWHASCTCRMGAAGDVHRHLGARAREAGGEAGRVAGP